jgi:hypothetical protein
VLYVERWEEHACAWIDTLESIFFIAFKRREEIWER